MTVPLQDPEIAHSGNGVTTVFPFPFLVFDAEDLVVAVGGVVKTLNVDYAVTDLDNPAGGSVTFVSAPPAGTSNVTLQRAVVLARETDYQYAGDFQSKTVNRDMDRPWMALQELRKLSDRTLRVPIGESGNLTLPPLAQRALRGLAFDVDGNLIAAPASDASSLGAQLLSYGASLAGAGIVGFAPGLSYAPNTVGERLAGLASLTDAAKGAAYVGYKLNAAGAVGRTLAAKLFDRISVRDFGAMGDGVTDDTLAMQAAHATGKVVHYPAGIYLYQGNVSFIKGGAIGDGGNLTTLRINHATNNGLTWNGTGQASYDGTLIGPQFSGINFDTAVTRTAGAYLTISPSSGEVTFAKIFNCRFYSGYNQLYLHNVSHYKVWGCDFISYANHGIFTDNTNHNDSGDSCIFGNTFNTNQATGNGVFQQSGGGLKITGNKFLGGLTGYTLSAVISQNVADLIIANNSIENTAGAGISLVRTSGAFGWGGIVISGNQLGFNPVSISIGTAAAWLSDLTITGNTLDQISTGQTGIFADYLLDFLISSNKFSGNGGTSVGISLGSHCTSGNLGVNKYYGLGTSFSNASPTTTFPGAGLKQSGTANVTTNAAYGSLFTGSTTISYPSPVYTKVPNGRAFVLSGAGGGVSCIVSTTLTQITITVIGVTNGGSVAVGWDVTGFGE